MGFRSNPLLGYWRRMCEEPTEAEAALEPAIAALGERYRHQYPFWDFKYFADFALLDRKLIIEVDGDSHDRPAQKEKDLQHELKVLELGWRVVRLTNEAALEDPEFAVKAAIATDEIALDTVDVKTRLEAQLAQLHRNYPALLAAAAKRSKRRRQSALKGAAVRRAKKAAGAYPQRKREALALHPAWSAPGHS